MSGVSMADVKRLLERIEALEEAKLSAYQMINDLGLTLQSLSARVDLLAEQGAGAAEQLKKVNTIVGSTNRSAPKKRNMTDADALAVLTGDHKEKSHKEAGEAIGLTYAQVYSCRCEFTFKHVHKHLRDSGWKNPFALDAPRRMK